MQLMQPVIGGENTALDLSTLTSGERFTVETCVNEVRNFMRRTARDAVVVGRKIQAVKKILGHGRFIAWLRTECPLPEDTAERFMKIAERFGDIPHNAEFALTALYTLATDDTPDSAREEAVKLAAKGEKITPALAKAIKVRHATAAVPVPPSEETQSNGSKTDDTPPAQEVVTDSVEDRGSTSSSSAPGEAEHPAQTQKHRVSSYSGNEQKRARQGSIPSVRPKLASPDELLKVVNLLLAALPSVGHPDWEKFARKVRGMPPRRRRTLLEGLTKVAEAAAGVRSKL